jgi:hypothetical protein
MGKLKPKPTSARPRSEGAPLVTELPDGVTRIGDSDDYLAPGGDILYKRPGGWKRMRW